MICKEFGVNYTWITTGEGDIYLTGKEAQQAKIENFMDSLNLTPYLRAALLALAEMPPEFIQQVNTYISRVIKQTRETDTQE